MLSFVRTLTKWTDPENTHLSHSKSTCFVAANVGYDGKPLDATGAISLAPPANSDSVDSRIHPTDQGVSLRQLPTSCGERQGYDGDQRCRED